MIDLYPISNFSRDVCNFPLHHDTIIRLEFYEPRLVKYQYFSCVSANTAVIVSCISKVCSVRRIEIVSVEKIPKYF